jgi:hypothetical protein
MYAASKIAAKIHGVIFAPVSKCRSSPFDFRMNANSCFLCYATSKKINSPRVLPRLRQCREGEFSRNLAHHFGRGNFEKKLVNVEQIRN